MRLSILIQSLFIVMMFNFTCSAQRFGPPRTLDPNLILLSLPQVQRELEISHRQTELLEAVREDLIAQMRTRRRGRQGDQEDRAKLRDVTEKLSSVILEEKQARRLREVRRQFEGLYAVDNDSFAKHLNLSNKQITGIRRIRSADDEINALDLLDKVIDDGQLDKWQESLGKEFEFDEDLLEIRRFYLARRGRQFRRGPQGRGAPENSESE